MGISTDQSEKYQSINEIDLSGIIPQIEGLHPEAKGAQYEIISRVAYLIGVQERIFQNEHEPPKYEIYQKLQRNKRARIIRNLCRIRTELEIHFLKICNAMQREHKSLIGVPEYLPIDCMQELKEDGVDIYRHIQGTSPSPFLFHLNEIIKSRINNCKDLFPDWLDWNYLSQIFIMPDGMTDEGTKAAASVYYENQQMYPYQQYICWEPQECGNILYNDRRFVTLLYEWNGDEFRDFSLVADVSDATKSNIYDFIEQSKKTVFIVDCENSDPYALCAAIRNLDQDRLGRIEKMILYDDVHAASAWEMLSDYVSIPVEYIMIERLKDNKSLADIKVATRTCQEFYKNGVDSFVLVSSDSDYWGLIEELPEVKFFVMIQHIKSSYALREALITKDIRFCYIDDFYDGDGNEIKTDAMKREFDRVFRDALELNLNRVMEQVLERTRIDMNAEEKSGFLKKYISNVISLEIDRNLDVRIKRRDRG